jgi:hypothetical protein
MEPEDRSLMQGMDLGSIGQIAKDMLNTGNGVTVLMGHPGYQALAKKISVLTADQYANRNFIYNLLSHVAEGNTMTVANNGKPEPKAVGDVRIVNGHQRMMTPPSLNNLWEGSAKREPRGTRISSFQYFDPPHQSNVAEHVGALQLRPTNPRSRFTFLPPEQTAQSSLSTNNYVIKISTVSSTAKPVPRPLSYHPYPLSQGKRKSTENAIKMGTLLSHSRNASAGKMLATNLPEELVSVPSTNSNNCKPFHIFSPPPTKAVPTFPPPLYSKNIPEPPSNLPLFPHPTLTSSPGFPSKFETQQKTAASLC